eukprot:evm.model.scf_75.2 EVM.evm.TU.scf_75.2   scf_75:9856-14024(+)
MVTNLRIIWTSDRSRRANISIGFNCVTNFVVKTATSRIKGECQAVHVLTKFNGSRYEFIFSSTTLHLPAFVTTLFAVRRAYDSSRLYRELKLRGAFLDGKELKLLPGEQVYNKVHGAWNLSADQGNLGTFVLTNVRVVWHADLAENFNISIPYMQNGTTAPACEFLEVRLFGDHLSDLDDRHSSGHLEPTPSSDRGADPARALQMKSIKLRESKFGLALVITCTQAAGGYVLGFRIDPKEAMVATHDEIKALWKVFAQSPLFGVDVTLADNRNLAGIADIEEDVHIVDEEDKGDVFATYYADASKSLDRPPVYSPELGLAIEALRDGDSLEQFWSVA